MGEDLMSSRKLVYNVKISGDRPIAQLMQVEQAVKERLLALDKPMSNENYSPEVQAIFAQDATDLSNALAAILRVYDNPALEEGE
jgi:hypothetical protein